MHSISIFFLLSALRKPEIAFVSEGIVKREKLRSEDTSSINKENTNKEGEKKLKCYKLTTVKKIKIKYRQVLR